MLHQVERFYRELWEAEKKEELSSICAHNFNFRGSLGSERIGHDEFWDYLLMVRGALSDYRCIIEEAVSEQNRVFAKMKFEGIHKETFMQYPPTNLKVSWNGAALFTFKDSLIIDLWVLGDIHSLLELLKKQSEQNDGVNQI